MHTPKMTASALLAIGLFLTASQGLAQPYEVSMVPTIDGDSVAAHLNDAGTIVGAGGFNERALVVFKNDPFYIEGFPEGYQFAERVNNQGLVAGWYQGQGLSGVFTFSLSSRELTLLPSSTASWIYDLNDAGVAVGSSDAAGALWINGSRYFLEDLLDGGSPYPIRDVLAVDNHGTVLAIVDAPTYGAMVASPQDDGTYIGSPLPFGVFPVALSDNSRLMLSYELNEVRVRSLDDGTVRTMPRHPDDIYLSPADINDAGIVVGMQSGTSGFLWNSQTGERRTLNALIRPDLQVSLSRGESINNRGVILAHGVGPQALPGIFTLTPPCFGDADGNRVVTVSDLSRVLSRFGTAVAQAYDSPDLNGDALVNLEDVQRVLSNFGKAC